MTTSDYNVISTEEYLPTLGVSQLYEEVETIRTKGISFNTQLALYVVIGAFGLSGNGIVLLVMIKNANMRKSLFNRLLMYQSFTDGMAALFVIILSYIRYDNEITFMGKLGDLLCRLWMPKSIMWGLFVASNFNLVILTLERYLNLINPLLYKRVVTSRRLYIIMIVTTLLCLVFIFSRDYNTSGLRENGVCHAVTLYKSKELFRAVILLSASVQFYLPLLIMLIAYVHIFIFLLKKSQQQGLGQEPGSRRNERLQKASQNILKTMIIVCLLFFLCWAGNTIAVVLLAFDIVKPFFSSPWYHVSTYLCFLNCTVNPVIYSLQYEEFQVAAKALFCKEGTRKVLKETSITKSRVNTDDTHSTTLT